jgi:hypothetical protein
VLLLNYDADAFVLCEYIGVWFMHCHFDKHMTWGMDMAFVVKNGKGPEAHIIPRPLPMIGGEWQRSGRIFVDKLDFLDAFILSV